MPTKILLADDHQVYREQLRALLNQNPDLTVVGEAEDGQAAVKLVQDLAKQGQAPDVVLMDVVMPKLNGVEATRQIVSAVPGAKGLALSLYAERQWVEAMVHAGASGYVLKDDPYTELLHAIREVAAGQTYFSRQIVPRYDEPDDLPPPP